jgi:enoyl-[acyl-carrier-protein] reductase (NADH)
VPARMEGKKAVVVGAGQPRHHLLGNGRAIATVGHRSVPLARMGTAMDVANAVLFLSSEESEFTTGLEVPVDGGTLAIIGRYERRETP